MPIHRQMAVGLRIPEQDFHWNESDMVRYRLAVGQSVAQREVLPTFAMTAPGAFGVVSPDFYHPEPPEIRFPGIRLNLATLLQLEQQLEVHHPLPHTGSARCRGEVVAVEEHGDAAVLVQRTDLLGTDGTVLVSGTSRVHARGEGNGEAGDRPQPDRTPIPDRAPDAEVLTPTLRYQALWYQRCGRGNSMLGNVHTDPAFARAAGLPDPIMQGVCTYAMVCAVIVDTVLEGQASRVRRYTARFRGIVFPGETLRTRIWSDEDRHVFATSIPARADKCVLTGVLRTR
ncbi:MaoC/PaaZ C-terminal domain-containing protein [Nocardia paucivorans]|uniref:MaoC/PaaZ C-terminal domain-containing protein n=1 Tax=Nocardia paucivorans TaxID=114259 RepID=UPI0003146D1F|nr:MaoC/PaaZ C-terminal domain-containing protein [Nocardia paucivorans]